jgi:hypothetical protein
MRKLAARFVSTEVDGTTDKIDFFKGASAGFSGAPLQAWPKYRNTLTMATRLNKTSPVACVEFSYIA